MFRQAPSFPYHDLGIVEDGNTASRAISKDAYVIWKGSSYFASTDILQGATLEEDVNLTAIPDGVINGVVSALNNNLYPEADFVAGTSSQGIVAYRIGNMVYLMSAGNGASITTSGLEITDSKFLPKYDIGVPCVRYGGPWIADAWINIATTGVLKVYNTSGNVIATTACRFLAVYEAAT